MIHQQKIRWYITQATTTGWWRRISWYRTHAIYRRWLKEVREGKFIKILTRNKLLTRPTVLLLAEIKAGNNSYKLKNEIRQILIFCISTIKSPKNFTIFSSHYNNGSTH